MLTIYLIFNITDDTKQSKRKWRSYGVLTLSFSMCISSTKAALSAHQGPKNKNV